MDFEVVVIKMGSARQVLSVTPACCLILIDLKALRHARMYLARLGTAGGVMFVNESRLVR